LSAPKGVRSGRSRAAVSLARAPSPALIVAQMGETAARVFDLKSKTVVKTLGAAIEACGVSL